MSVTTSVILGVLAFGVACVLTRWLFSAASPMVATAVPNERSLHDQPTATGGGIAITVSLVVFGSVLAVLTPHPSLPWIGGVALVVAIVSLVDDLHPLSPLLRLAIHGIAGVLSVSAGFIPEVLSLPGMSVPLAGWVATVFCVLFVVWMINLYNFMDGMDGFAGGMAVVGFLTFALLASETGAHTFMTVNLIIAGATAGFLVFNFPPARIFLGDVGASTLGLLAAVLSLWAHRDGVFPLWIGLLVFSPFVVDSTVTLLLRMARRQRVWQAHKSHFYQRLVGVGWGHKRTVLWEYLLMLLCSVSAVMALRLNVTGQWLLLSGWALTYTVLMCFVYRLDANFKAPS